MRLAVPNSPKVYTTTYQDNKGVDFTNDPSNVWYRRSPDAVNMLPDESGRPFKRTGWEKKITAETFAQKYTTDTGVSFSPSEITIRKCYYFELAGVDHIIIFTNYGVFVYHNDTLYSSKDINPTLIAYSANYQSLTDAQKAEYDLAYESYNSDMIESFDRAFFFEGAGKAAFYIYGGFKIWEYAYVSEDKFSWQTVEPHVPRVNIGVDARHEAGTSYETINMLSDYICEEFENNVYLYVSSYNTGTLTPTSVDDTQFIAMVGEAGTYTFTYTDADHSWLLGGDQVMISNYGITLSSSPADGNTIIVVLDGSKHRINLPRVILSPDKMRVDVSSQTQFDTKLNIITTGTPSSAQVLLKKDNADNFSHLEFADEYLPLVEGEDCIRVTYPRNAISTTSHTVSSGSITVTADEA